MKNQKLSKKIAEIIRVDHAGECGAQVIYQGQIGAMKLKNFFFNNSQNIAIIESMKDQEVEHFKYFDNLLKENQIRPTLMQPIWKMGGFSLGFFTAILGNKTAMACTTAVEEVIEKHYQQQINILSAEIDKQENIEQKSDMSNLAQKIKEFQADEVHHRDIAYDNKAKESPIFIPLTNFIKLITETAIKVSKKI